MEIYKVAWGNSIDGSLSAIILAKNDAGELHWYLGSRNKATTKEDDIEWILKWGNKIPVDKL